MHHINCCLPAHSIEMPKQLHYQDKVFDYTSPPIQKESNRFHFQIIQIWRVWVWSGFYFMANGFPVQNDPFDLIPFVLIQSKNLCLKTLSLKAGC